MGQHMSGLRLPVLAIALAITHLCRLPPVPELAAMGLLLASSRDDALQQSSEKTQRREGVAGIVADTTLNATAVAI